MALSTLSGLLAAEAGQQRIPLLTQNTGAMAVTTSGATYFAGVASTLASRPAAWTIGTPGTAGRVVDNTDTGGAIPIPAASPDKNYVLGLSWSTNTTSVARAAALVDVYWVNTGISIATAALQTWTPVALPARAGTGEGVQAGLLVTTTTPATALASLTISYTNSDGTAGRTGTLDGGLPATARVGQVFPFALQAGDVGVQSIEGITLGGTLASGALSLVLFRRLALVGCGGTSTVQNANQSSARTQPPGEGSVLTHGLPVVADTAHIQAWELTRNTAAQLSVGEVLIGQG